MMNVQAALLEFFTLGYNYKEKFHGLLDFIQMYKLMQFYFISRCIESSAIVQICDSS